jgi:hypothetical protein
MSAMTFVVAIAKNKPPSRSTLSATNDGISSPGRVACQILCIREIAREREREASVMHV